MNPTAEKKQLEPQLSKGLSVDVPTGSTIYDPAILSLREDFKAKVEERKAKQLQRFPDNDIPVQSPMHVSVSSPIPRKSRKSRKSLFLRADGDITGSESEDLELGDFDGETEVCCNGYVSLYPFLLFMSAVKIWRLTVVCFHALLRSAGWDRWNHYWSFSADDRVVSVRYCIHCNRSTTGDIRISRRRLVFNPFAF
ncbi:hypothetical protein FGB62_233g022 [Gracilaria domingensis]|nr:hypothetical protein FGB62_233g022 [Gracilaria domingensis]